MTSVAQPPPLKTFARGRPMREKLGNHFSPIDCEENNFIINSDVDETRRRTFYGFARNFLLIYIVRS